MNILIVEDELTSRELLKVILEPYGSIQTVADGIEALKAFNLALAEKPYDLICLDIMLPKMDGQQVLKGIRKIEADKGILGPDAVKILMISALGDFESVSEAFSSQCTSYITKPIDADKIVAELRNLELI
ncbi:MAG: response regulator [Spirochaetaceae bacterium]|nr:MAG: response regulator [Spirochaetaceae bacterium]